MEGAQLLAEPQAGICLGLSHARAGVQATGSPTDFPKTKEAYVNWGDMDDDGDSSSRFKGPLEPFTKPLVEQK